MWNSPNGDKCISGIHEPTDRGTLLDSLYFYFNEKLTTKEGNSFTVSVQSNVNLLSLNNTRMALKKIFIEICITFS